MASSLDLVYPALLFGMISNKISDIILLLDQNQVLSSHLKLVMVFMS